MSIPVGILVTQDDKISSLVFVFGCVTQSFIPNIFQSVLPLASGLGGLAHPKFWVSDSPFSPGFEKPNGISVSYPW